MKMTAFWDVALCFLVEVRAIAVMMKAVHTSETSGYLHETTVVHPTKLSSSFNMFSILQLRIAFVFSINLLTNITIATASGVCYGCSTAVFKY
jgi:hypothetical protein